MKKVFLLIMAVMLCAAIALPFIGKTDGSTALAESTITRDDYVKLSDAFNALGDKDTTDMGNGLHLFDSKNEQFKNLFISVDNTEALYGGDIKFSKQEITEAYAKEIGADLNVGVHAYGVKANIGALFDTSTELINGSVASERYEYYLAYSQRKVVTVDWMHEDIKDCINAGAKSELKNIDSIDAAKRFLNDYGTHVFGAYYFGGRLTVARYTASSEDVSKQLNETNGNLKVLIDTAISSLDGGGSFSISGSSAAKKGITVDNMEINAKGGSDLTGLTIDGLFTYNDQIVDSHYVYAEWLKSLDSGNNLRIIKTERAIPIWKVLAKSGLINSEQEKYLQSAFDIYDFQEYAKGCEQLGIDCKYMKAATYKDVDGSMVSAPIIDNTVALTGNIEVEFVLGDILTESHEKEEFTFKIDGDVDYARIEGGKLIVNDAKGKPSLDLKLYFGGVMLYTIEIEWINDDFAGGFGTEERPYIIADYKQWNNFIKNYTDKNLYFKLGADIDFKRSNIASDSAKKTFNGHLNGNGHLLKNISYIYTKVNDAWGDIGLLGINKGTIENLNIYNMKIINNNVLKAKYGDINCGALVGKNEGTIKNVHINDCSIRIAAMFEDDSALNMGALVGLNNGNISFSSVAECNVYGVANSEKGKFNIGGLVGKNDNAYVENCYVRNSKINANNNGSSEASSEVHYIGDVGGLFGSSNKSTIILCMAYYNELKAKHIDKQHKVSLGNIAGTDEGSKFNSCYFVQDSDGNNAIAGINNSGCKQLKEPTVENTHDVEVAKYWMDAEYEDKDGSTKKILILKIQGEKQ